MGEEIMSISNYIESLEHKTSSLREDLTDAKETSVFIMEAAHLWDEVKCLTDIASQNSERFENILRKAASKFSQEKMLKFLSSNGTKRITGSFKDCWMEIIELVDSDEFVFPIDSSVELDSNFNQLYIS